MRFPCLSLLTCFALTTLAGCAPVATEPPPPQPPPEPTAGRIPVTGVTFPVITRHEGVFNGKRIAYTATVGALDVNDADGKPGARIVSTSYVADHEPGKADRPIMFVWNGGPISASPYLHLGAFGPKRVAFPDDLSADPGQAPLIDNPHSILYVADLVYFDPAGTGFSRTLPGKKLEEVAQAALRPRGDRPDGETKDEPKEPAKDGT